MTALDDEIHALRDRVAELETARLRAETLFAVTQVLSETLSLRDTFETILDELHALCPTTAAPSR